MSNNQTAPVNCHNHALIVVTRNSQCLVAMRPIFNGIGLDWKAEYSRIQRDKVLSSIVIIMTTASPQISKWLAIRH